MPKGSEPRGFKNAYFNVQRKKQKFEELAASKTSSFKDLSAAFDSYASANKRFQEGRPKTVLRKKRYLDATSFGGLDYQMRKKAEKVKSGRAAFMPVKKTIRPAVSAKKGK